MSHEKTTLEVIAPTVEEAVQKGLAQLNLPQDAVEVEVLDPGSRGLFGLGSRQARIRLTIRPMAGDRPAAAPRVEASSQAREAAVVEPPSRPEPVRREPLAKPSEPQSAVVDQPSVEDDETLRVASEVVSELLDKMKVRAKISSSYRGPEDEEDEEMVMVNVEGNDLSILIGRRSETLNALQYISSLIVSKRLDRWVPLMIDVQGYRARRERQLRQIARRMADQAVNTGRRQILEPMPANERRLIHLELRNHPQVETESVGDEPNRKVTISLKK